MIASNNNNNKSYAAVSYRQPKQAAATVEETKVSPPAFVSDSIENDTMKPSMLVKERAVIFDPMVSKVKRRTSMFEEMAKPKPVVGPCVKKSWVKNSKGGTNYEAKFIRFTNLPPKKTLADLP